MPKKKYKKNDIKDVKDARKLLFLIIALISVIIIAIILMTPLLLEIISMHLAPTIGIKNAAIVSFFVSLIVMLIFAIFSGDGIIGELPFMIGGFFIFFVFLFLLISLIF